MPLAPSRQYHGRGCTSAAQPDLDGAARHGHWEGGKVVGTFPIPMAEIAQPPAQMPGDRGARALISIWLTLERKTRSIDRYPVGKPARADREERLHGIDISSWN
jgi:hypothetical protein